MEKAQIIGKWIILWEVGFYNHEEEKIIMKRFKDPQKAAMCCINNNYNFVEMRLFKKEWNPKTDD